MFDNDLRSDDEGRTDGRWLIALLAVVVVGFGAYLIVAMPGMDHGGGSMSAMPQMSTPSSQAVSVDDFAARMADPDSFVVNVHVPAEGTIDVTDIKIAYNRILGDGRLPSKRSTPILLYCKTGSMATEAAATLMTAGYTDVATLDGGMRAWAAAGRPLHGT